MMEYRVYFALDLIAYREFRPDIHDQTHTFNLTTRGQAQHLSDRVIALSWDSNL